MATKSHKTWTDAEEVFLIEHHGQMNNREIAKRLGRGTYAIECRIARLRKAGLMKSAPKEPPWTEADDRELVACYQSLTTDMLADRFGRTKGSIDTRIRRLRERGWKIDAMPRGRVRTKQAEKAKAEWQEPELSIEVERETLREEIARYLAAEVNANRLDSNQVREMIGRLKSNVLAAPQHRLRKFLAMPVAQIVREAA